MVCCQPKIMIVIRYNRTNLINACPDKNDYKTAYANPTRLLLHHPYQSTEYHVNRNKPQSSSFQDCGASKKKCYYKFLSIIPVLIIFIYCHHCISIPRYGQISILIQFDNTENICMRKFVGYRSHMISQLLDFPSPFIIINNPMSNCRNPYPAIIIQTEFTDRLPVRPKSITRKKLRFVASSKIILPFSSIRQILFLSEE